MTEQTFPRARHVQIGYSEVEDRVLLRLTLAAEGGVADCWLPRRLLLRMVDQLGELMRRSHPATEGEPAVDAIMALEHQAARSGAGAAPDDPADDPAGDPEEDPGPDPDSVRAWLVTHVTMETGTEAPIAMGITGRPGTLPAPAATEPVAGLALTREQAHALLQSLTDRAEHAGWGLPRRLKWLRQDDW